MTAREVIATLSIFANDVEVRIIDDNGDEHSIDAIGSEGIIREPGEKPKRYIELLVTRIS